MVFLSVLLADIFLVWSTAESECVIEIADAITCRSSGFGRSGLENGQSWCLHWADYCFSWVCRS